MSNLIVEKGEFPPMCIKVGADGEEYYALSDGNCLLLPLEKAMEIVTSLNAIYGKTTQKDIDAYNQYVLDVLAEREA